MGNFESFGYQPSVNFECLGVILEPMHLLLRDSVLESMREYVIHASLKPELIESHVSRHS